MVESFIAPSVGNTIISRLPKNEAKLLCHAVSVVTLSRGQVLVQRGGEVEFAHFLESGAVSLSIDLDERHRVGFALVGREGIVEALTLLGIGDRSTYHVVVEIPGKAYRVQMAQLRTILDNSSVLRHLCKCYTQFLALQAAQLAA